ncbi:MAG: phage/plasmid primase, P4 family [Pseudomonadota bacterium]
MSALDASSSNPRYVELPGFIEPSEDGVARAFTEAHGQYLKFDHDANTWYGWQGDHWGKEGTGKAFNYCRELARTASEGLKQDMQAKLRRASFATGVERMARCDPVHAVNADEWNADPWQLGCPNGTVNLRTGEVDDPHPSDRITRVTAVAPALTPHCPTWLSFLRQATGGDLEMVAFLKRWCGYSLTGSTREHALIFLYGPGGNGKSVFLNSVSGILGGYATIAAMDVFTASKTSQHLTFLAMLDGARMVTASETEEGRAWAEARIKQMTGGDPITANYMRQDPFTFTPQFKLTIVGNHQPVLHNVDDAARRRFNIVPFTVKPSNPDRDLEAKLKREWPGILRWMIEGCLEWQEHGLRPPESVLAATAAYFEDQDFVGQWLADKTVVEPANDHRWETAADLFSSWKDYALAAGESPGTSKSLASKLTRHGLRRVTKKMQGSAKRAWLGVSLNRPEGWHDVDG